MLKKTVSTKDWLPIEDILDDGILLTKNKEYIKIIKIIPINYNLKTELEKNSILKSYKEFLKICNFDIQIIIQSNKEDLSLIISKIDKQKVNENKKIKIISQEYIKFINSLNSGKKASSKNYYIILKSISIDQKIAIEELKEKYIKVKETLSKCGNKVINLEKNEIINILFSFFNVRMYYLKNRKEKYWRKVIIFLIKI